METVASLFWEYAPQPPAPRTWRTWFTDSRPSLHTTQQFVERQLFLRPKPSPARWGTDVTRIRIGQFLCRTAKEQYGWSNDYFLPDDPFNIVFLIWWDDLDIIEVAMKIEEEFENELPEYDVALLCGGTMDDFVDLVLSKKRKPPHLC